MVHSSLFVVHLGWVTLKVKVNQLLKNMFAHLLLIINSDFFDRLTIAILFDMREEN
jgi:hypothetical protein